MESTATDIIAQFKQMPIGWITDAFSRLGLVGWSEGVQPLSQTARRFAGRAVTVQYLPKRGGSRKMPSHYEIIRNVAEPGDVLVIAAAGTSCWLLGENQAHAALYRGLAGICVDGCIRDMDEIAALPLPVFARGAGIRPYSAELELVSVNVPVSFAGMQIRSGDIVVGDGDGLLAVPAEQAGAVLLQALDIAGLEQELEEAIKRQAPLEEIERLGKRKKISKAE